ncbi:hypothetical protein BGX27_009652 [Mortierella sp. AM989]|nr:hypothetical protein BGX27_009652 [Mortierella sp. AM989]
MTTPPTYNILILGETQAGKSTFIEATKRYADPKYKIDKTVVGGGVFSHTSTVRSSEVTTNLPSYYVFKTSPNPDGDKETFPVDYGSFIDQTEDEDDYEDAINDRKCELSQGEATGGQVERRFNLIDTPGLNDTNNFDEIHVSSIFKALKNIQDIHLVLIAVSNSPLADGVKHAIGCYVDMLPNFKGILAFVHTHIKYKSLHPSNERFADAMEEKKRILSDVTKTKNVPSFMIDCDLNYPRPIQACITHNTIRGILSLAPFNQPISVATLTMNKTPKMVDVDMFLKEKYETVIKARGKVLKDKDREQSEVLSTIGKLKASICEKEQELEDVRRQLSLHQSDEMVLLAQELFQQDWSPKKIVKKRSMKFNCDYQIDHHDVRAYNIEITNEIGGKGYFFWKAEYRRARYQHGILHAKSYVKKRKMFEKEIQTWGSAIYRLPGEIEDDQRDLEKYEKEKEEHQKAIQVLLDELEMNQYLLNQVSKKELEVEIFHELVDTKAYIGTQVENLKVVEKYYLDNRERFKNQSYETERVFAAPLETTSRSIADEGATPTVVADDTENAKDAEDAEDVKDMH